IRSDSRESGNRGWRRHGALSAQAISRACSMCGEASETNVSPKKFGRPDAGAVFAFADEKMTPGACPYERSMHHEFTARIECRASRHGFLQRKIAGQPRQRRLFSVHRELLARVAPSTGSTIAGISAIPSISFLGQQ